MRPCLEKSPIRRKAIILIHIYKDLATSDEEMETLLVSLPDSTAASECIGEEEEDG